DLADERGVVRQEKVDAGLHGAREMDCICSRNSLGRANAGVDIRRLQCVGYDFHKWEPKYIANFPGRICRACLVETYQSLPDGKGTGAKLILEGFHSLEQLAHAPGVAGVVLQPVNKQH